MRMLCVGAASPARDYLVKALVEANHSAVTVDDERDGAYMSFTERFDVVLLMGREATPRLATLFKVNTRVNVVVAIADWPNPDARAAMLGAGADACFEMRFSLAELMARLDALKRTTSADRSAARLDPGRRCLVYAESTMLLSHAEYLLIECLLRCPGAVVSYAELIDYAFPGADADRKTLTYTISRLRQRLTSMVGPPTVEVVRNIGYRIAFDEYLANA